MDTVYWHKIVRAGQKKAIEKAFVGLIEKNYKQGVSTKQSMFAMFAIISQGKSNS